MEAERRALFQNTTDELEDALLATDRGRARLCFEGSGLPPESFAESVVTEALERIGKAWEQGEVALAQIYMSGRICEELLEAILPKGSRQSRPHPPMAMAVLDDFHPLGKRMVLSVLRAHGYSVRDYGAATVPELLEKVRRDGIRILLISTLMLNSALKVRLLRQALDAAGLNVKLVVGGAPFRMDRNLWREVGADATSDSASGAASVISLIVEELTWKR